MSVDVFAHLFRDEHRAIRDTLLDLVQAFQARDIARVRSLLGQAAALTGPHFRYEEEALYPALVEIYGEDYIEKLLGDHDRAVGAAEQLVRIAEKDALPDADAARGTRLVRGLLPHVSDCEGLSIMVERLPARSVQAILEARARSQAAGLDLLQWAGRVRARPPVPPE